MYIHSCFRKEIIIAPAIYRILCATTTDPGSFADNTHYNPRNTQYKIVHTLLVWKKTAQCIHQAMYWIIREYLYVYIFASNGYSHTSSSWNVQHENSVRML
jgi:hypothetical protein